MKKTKKTNNPVAKFSRRYNKSVVMVDRKREMKKTGERGRKTCVDEDFYDSAGGFNEYI
mgnify:CR=1 FL=1